MSLLEIFLTAVSLSLDAVAVSIAAAVLSKISFKQALKISLFFGIFQFAMPIFGMLLGSGFKSYLINYGNIVGFLALVILGGKMLYEAFRKTSREETEEEKHLAETKVLTILAVTTSIDAFIIGITFNFIKINIPLATLVIGIVTFLFCFIGIYIGSKGRHLIGNKIELLGALILIGLGFKILLVQ